VTCWAVLPDLDAAFAFLACAAGISSSQLMRVWRNDRVTMMGVGWGAERRRRTSLQATVTRGDVRCAARSHADGSNETRPLHVD
jgi:hypothetical protein